MLLNKTQLRKYLNNNVLGSYTKKSSESLKYFLFILVYHIKDSLSKLTKAVFIDTKTAYSRGCKRI